MTIDFPKPRDIPALRGLWREAFGDSEEFLDIFFGTAMDPHRCFVAKDGDRLAAMLYWFDCTCRGQKTAYLYAAATAKAYRGQGICRKLMAHTHAYLQGLGYVGTFLVPAEESLFGFYGKMGYETFCSMEDLPCTAHGEPPQLRAIDAAEYGRLRRDFLPKGAVIQEGENLDFLAAQCDFYAGSDWILAARNEEGKLLTLELLGNPAAAPAILKALGCDEGTIRVFGQGQPFAMYRPLTADPAPTYFAFAFD